MISIFSLKSGKLLRNVTSLDGEDMRGNGSTDCPDGWDVMRWDKAAREWVEDALLAAEIERQRIDSAYLCEHGEGAKREAHHRKAIEAHLFMANGDPAAAPMLAAEAAATGVTLADLAQAVVKKDREWIAREVGRRTAKTEGTI